MCASFYRIIKIRLEILDTKYRLGKIQQRETVFLVPNTSAIEFEFSNDIQRLY